MRLSDVNTDDLLGAIRLGCRAMSRAFDADDGDVPFFDVVVRPEARMAFSPWTSEAHVPGRHLNALLTSEAVAGVEIEEEAVEKHARAALFSYGGPVALSLNRKERTGPLVNFNPHNVREGLHALYALARYRDSSEAHATAEAAIATVFDYWDGERGWDYDRLEARHGLSTRRSPFFIYGVARAIGPLVKYYRVTGHGPALELATALKEKALDGIFDENGRYDVDVFGPHTHSTTCVMSSLAQLADLTSDSHLMGRVKSFYDNGLWQIRDGLGWVVESDRPGADPDRGEVNNTGDILETALILGRWGNSECYQDAERILRGHLLPSQLRDTSFIEDPPNPLGIDGKRDVADRLRGAFGFPAPYGHEPLDAPPVKFNMDIVGGAVGSLCEAYREATRLDETGHRVNLLFDHETSTIAVESPYTHPSLRVRVKKQAPLHLRVPPWAGSPLAKVQGAEVAGTYAGGYLLIARPPVNRWVTLSFPLVEQEITLEHRTRRIRARLRGDQVMAMDSFGADLNFFEPLG